MNTSMGWNIAVLLLASAASPACGAPLVTLHTFDQPASIVDGGEPMDSPVMGSDGYLYGTTSRGGTAGTGTVYKVSASGAMTILHSFGDGSVPDDGILPEGSLIEAPDGNFYGTTKLGGYEHGGTVFRITPAGKIGILHLFGLASNPFDGSWPNGALCLASNRRIYGTTDFGGNAGGGTVFELTLDGKYSVLHNFGDGIDDDGWSPLAGVIQGADGRLYGTTEGGGSDGQGTVYAITRDGVETILHSFNDPSIKNDGTEPEVELVAGRDGCYYSTTRYGGSYGGGVVYKISASGKLTVIHSFANIPNYLDGMTTNSRLALGPDGWLYGTTEFSGTVGVGMLYRIGPDGRFSVAHSFREAAIASDGAEPSSGLWIGPTGLMYGSTTAGGVAGQGAIFSFSPAAGLQNLHSFKQVALDDDGSEPQASLTLGQNGRYYGTSASGGAAGWGTIFTITPSGKCVILHSFGDGAVDHDGSTPVAPLLLASDGNFYGTTMFRGDLQTIGGTVFRMTPSGKMTILHRFQRHSANDGCWPMGGLIQGQDGCLYGTTAIGGSSGGGTVFRMTLSGQLTIIHSFYDGSVPDDGAQPVGGLVQGSDGTLYGATSTGASEWGTIFAMTTSGSETILHSFDSWSWPNSGEFPAGGLIFGNDGDLYGTTYAGGAYGFGDLFRMTQYGDFTTLYSFSGPAGAYPDAPLLLGSDGLLYGTTSSGGPNGGGTVFSVTLSGVETTLFGFNFTPELSWPCSPAAGLLEGLDGDLYGTASLGGSPLDQFDPGGSVFKVETHLKQQRSAVRLRARVG